MTAPSLVQSASFSTASSVNNGTATFASTPAQGDLLFCWVATGTQDVSSVATGATNWTKFGSTQTQGSSIKASLWYRVAGASEGTSVKVTIAAAAVNFGFIIFDLTGVNTAIGTSGIITPTNAVSNGSGSTIVGASGNTSTTVPAIAGLSLLCTYNSPNAFTSVSVLGNVATLVTPSATNNSEYLYGAWGTTSDQNITTAGSLVQGAFIYTTSRAYITIFVAFAASAMTYGGQATGSAIDTADSGDYEVDSQTATAITSAETNADSDVSATDSQTATAITGVGANADSGETATTSDTGATIAAVETTTSSSQSTSTATSATTVTAFATDTNSTRSVTDSQTASKVTIAYANANNRDLGAGQTLANTIALSINTKNGAATGKVTANATTIAMYETLGGLAKFTVSGHPGEVTGAWATATVRASFTAAKVGSATSTPTVHAGTRTAKVASAWSTPTVHSAWEVVA